MFHIDKTFLKDLLFVKKLINTPGVYLNHYGMRFMVYLIAKTLAEKKDNARDKNFVRPKIMYNK